MKPFVFEARLRLGRPDVETSLTPFDESLGKAHGVKSVRIECQYFGEHLFFPTENYLLKRRKNPPYLTVIAGRYDCCCRV